MSYNKVGVAHHLMHNIQCAKGSNKMPPKPKFTKEEITAAALELVSEQGAAALTARNIGDRLGISARPVFTAFKSMEEVQQEVRRAARTKFAAYTVKAADYTPAFKQMGMQVILFAKEEPRLFEFLFMKSNGTPHLLDEGYLQTDSPAKTALDMIQSDYDLCYDDARLLFHHIWIFTFGIGALFATGMCRFTDDELNELLGQNFTAMLNHIKSGKIYEPTVRPEPKGKSDAGSP